MSQMSTKGQKKVHLRDEGVLGRLLMIWAYRLVMLLTMMAGVCKLGMLPLQLKSASCVVVLLGYFMLMILLHETYRACDIGQARVTELVMSQVLTNTICLAAVYTGVALYVRQLFNPVTLILMGLAQLLLGIAWSSLAHRAYFKHRVSPRTAIIYRDEAQLEVLYQSPNFHERYDVVKLIPEPAEADEMLEEQLSDCNVVFTVGISEAITDFVVKHCMMKGIIIFCTPHLGQLIMAGAQHRANFSVPMLRLQRAAGYSVYRAQKRALDLFASMLGIIILSPVMAVTALAIWLEDHGPAFYRQVRLTKNGREFYILKFRSMRVNAEHDGVARLAGQNDARITRVGKFIRACRIDELPQLFNILMGDMSLVGPRPERPEIAKQYEAALPEFALRLQVKAGLTGWAQVYGRYNTEPYHKLQMDLMYIKEMSFLKDLQLILATLKILFVKESTQGVSHGQATALVSERPRNTKSA